MVWAVGYQLSAFGQAAMGMLGRLASRVYSSFDVAGEVTANSRNAALAAVRTE